MPHNRIGRYFRWSHTLPIIENSSYKAPIMFSNGHIQTCYPYFFRSVNPIDGEYFIIDTKDQDFLTANIKKVGSKTLAIVSHGVEGSIDANYVKGMAKSLNDNNIDALSWNMRSCGDEMNNQERYYHGGATDDLETVINYALKHESYDEIILIAFSLGSNITAKYLGEQGKNLPGKVTKSVIFSNPVDLACSNNRLHDTFNYHYMETFLKTMRWKLLEKHKNIKLDHLVDVENVHKVKTLWDFTENYVAPLHGFKSAAEYYELSSSRQYLHKIEIPTLMVSALNDPILGENCYPYEEAKKNKNLFLEIPDSGGHIGFISFKDYYWSEWRAQKFIEHTA
jgi:uncharacterized protein